MEVGVGEIDVYNLYGSNIIMITEDQNHASGIISSISN